MTKIIHLPSEMSLSDCCIPSFWQCGVSHSGFVLFCFFLFSVSFLLFLLFVSLVETEYHMTISDGPFCPDCNSAVFILIESR